MKNYAKAYTEVLEIITFMPEEEVEKIPIDRIKYFWENRDKDYSFKYDDTIPFEENNIMIETKAIFVELFRDYFASEKQKEKLEKILCQNEINRQKELQEKYSYENLFGNDDNKQHNEFDNKNEAQIFDVNIETESKVEIKTGIDTEIISDTGTDINGKNQAEIKEKNSAIGSNLITNEKSNIFKNIINKIKRLFKKDN